MVTYPAKFRGNDTRVAHRVDSRNAEHERGQGSFFYFFFITLKPRVE